MKRLILPFFCWLISIYSFAQTTTFDYASASLGSACNVFANSVNVNSVPHKTRAGTVSFTSGQGIFLATRPSGPTAGGSGYYISYPFASNNNYTIKITAQGGTGFVLGATVVPNLNQFNTTSENSCTPDANVNGYSGAGNGDINANPGSSTTTYSSNVFAGGGQSYLMIWARGGNPGLSADALRISKVEIVKSSAGPTSTLSASTSTIVCGSTTPVTFTVASNATGITNYTWNLGSSSNGWLHNGIDAPSTISTGTTNSITLTPKCGGSLSGVSATVTAGGNNYGTNSVTIGATQPSYSIIGSANICNSNQDYQVANLPCNASVIWEATPTGRVQINTNGNVATLTRLGNGLITLKAKVTSCGVTTDVPLEINVGVPYTAMSITNLYPSAPTCYGVQSFYIFQASYHYGDVPTTYQWGYRVAGSGGPDVIVSSNSQNAPFIFNTPGDYEIFARAITDCGVGTEVFYNLTVEEMCWGDGGIGLKQTAEARTGDTSVTDTYILYPNPASSNVTISKKDIKGSKPAEITEVKIFDKYGSLLKQQKVGKAKSVSVNVSHLKVDVYIVEIVSGKSSVRLPLVIKR